MAVILPDVRAQSSLPSLRVSPSIATITPQGGKGMEQMGSEIAMSGADLQRAGQIVAQANDQQDRQTALGSANKAQQAAMDLQYNPDTGFANAKGDQVLGKKFTDKYTQQFDDQLKSIRDNLQDDNQRKYFDQHADVLRLQFQGSLLRHQAQETAKFNDQTDDATIKLQLRSMATDPTNELAFQTGMVQINGVLDSMAKRKGMDPKAVEELKNQYKDAAYTTRITSILDGVPGVADANPKMAQAVFNQVSDQLSGPVKIQLSKQINAGVMDVDARDAGHKFVSNDRGQPLSGTQLKEDLYQRAAKARNWAEEQRPGDPKFADMVESRTLSYGRLIISQQEAQEAGLRDKMVAGMRGQNPDGSQAPKTIDQFFAIPGMRQAYNGASEQVKTAVTDHFKNGGGDVPRTGETQNLLYQYMGIAANNREQFAQTDLSGLIGKLPFADFDKLANLQLAARNKQDRDADKAANYQHALSLGLNYALKPLGISTPTPNTSSSKREQYDQFSGRLASWMDDFQAANKRPPNDKEIIAQAKNLTATINVPGMIWGTNETPAFGIKPEDESKATVTLDANNRDRITNALRSRYGFQPSESMVQQAAVYERLYPSNVEKWRGFDQTMRDYAKRQKPGVQR